MARRMATTTTPAAPAATAPSEPSEPAAAGAPASKRGRSPKPTVAPDGRARSGDFTVPGMSGEDGDTTVAALQDRLVALLDLGLTLKHIHWNVVGPDFIGVHEMIDPQYAAVQAMVDDVAERIATLGGAPNGLPGNIVTSRSWDDYDLGRALVSEHLGALDLVYAGVITDHRRAIHQLEDADVVTQDMLIGQTALLEKFQWFVRAHLETASGKLATTGATSERGAAEQARAGAARTNTGQD